MMMSLSPSRPGMHFSKEEALFFPLNLLSEEEIKPRYLQEEEEVGTASKKNHSVSILPALLEAECSRGGNGMMQLDSPCEPHIPKSSATNEERNAVVGLKRIDAIGRGGMLLQQEDSSSEPHIPESSATNEERNNVVELNNSIDDAKGGNSSSEKTDTIIWEKDHGINRQALELFGKSLNDAAKTLKRTGEMLLQQEDSSSEPHIPESSAINEERNNVVVVEFLNNSIDAKGGNISSNKTDTISRWEKDYGITLQVLEQLFGKSRDDAAKTLKGELTLQFYHIFDVIVFNIFLLYR
nr:protein NLP6-like [Ipomoea batatas]